MYALGIDLGTTFTAAATWRNGHAETASLGSRAAVIPSVVLLREDETFLTGEGANRRGLTEPHRVAREFKRRLGDTTPILLGGVPYSAEALMARLLRSVVDEVGRREGGAPTKICVSHPANWGPYKTDLLLQAVRLAGLEEPVSFTTEPEAAAVFYAQQNRIEAGAVVAVYDLGGGTFDAAVLRKSAVGFEILGRPEGIERLGGIDFDAAVFSHVARALGGKLDDLDEDDPSVITAVARLRGECVEAKEALSADTDVSIPVLLPNISTEVRLTRAELEAMVRPALYDSIEAMKRALRSANVTADQLHSVLLVGGSSRMPIVAQLVGAELGRPVAVDAHPKHAVALGAAWLASGALASEAAPRAVTGKAAVAAPSAAPPVVAQVVAPVRVPASPPASVAPVSPAIAAPTPAVLPTAPPPVAVSPRATASVPVPVGDAMTQLVAPPGAYGGPPVLTPEKRGLSTNRAVLLAAAAALVVLLAGGGIALALTGNGTPSGQPTAAGTGSAAATTAAAPVIPADEQCTDQIKSNPRWVCLTKATITGNQIRVEYQFGNGGTNFNINGGFHLHIYGASADGSDPADSIEGSQARGGNWYVEDKQPSVHSSDSNQYQVLEGHPKVCARIAKSNHQLVPDTSGSGTFKTGNCVPLVRA
jgi:molecular chaperone DnaK